MNLRDKCMATDFKMEIVVESVKLLGIHKQIKAIYHLHSHRGVILSFLCQLVMASHNQLTKSIIYKLKNQKLEDLDSKLLL